MRKVLVLAVLAICLAAFPRPAQAFLITGELDLAGGVRITDTGLLDFILPVDGTNGIEIIANSTNTDYFAVFNTFGIPYTIADLDLLAALFPAGPEGTFTELQGFETTPTSIQFGGQLSPLPDLTFSLLSIIPCQVGCGFGFAPQFNVVFSGGNTSVIMNITGTVCDPGNPLAECNHYTGQFTAQFVGLSPAQLIALLDSQGYIQTSFSASKISAAPGTVPEPASLLLFGTGSAIAATIARRRAKKKAKADADKV
jgi:PEP-CTERM motif